jgi:hypothetical protein
MPQQLQLTPTAGASTNPLGITFGATATIEFLSIPEKLLNKNVSGIELTMVDTVGAYVNKGPLNALIPWSNILSFIY